MTIAVGEQTCPPIVTHSRGRDHSIDNLQLLSHNDILFIKVSFMESGQVVLIGIILEPGLHSRLVTYYSPLLYVYCQKIWLPVHFLVKSFVRIAG